MTMTTDSIHENMASQTSVFYNIMGVDSHVVISTPSHVRGTIVLMHGWGCESSTLATIQNTALKCGFKVINVDFPGFGKSSEPEAIWGVDEFTHWLRELLTILGEEKPVMLGHSFGGRVGIRYASEWPVDKLVLVDAAGIKPKRSLKYYFKVYSFKLMKAVAPLLMGKSKAAKLIDKQRAKRGSSDYASASPKMRSILSKVVNEDLRHLLPSIPCPTLLIWGENDKATPLADAKLMEKSLPDAGLVSFPGCGHYSFLDNPIQFAAVLTSFLNS